MSASTIKILGIIIGLLIIVFALIIFFYMLTLIFMGNFQSVHNMTAISPGPKGDLAEAAIAMSMGRTDKAVEAYDRVISNDPENVTAWYSKGYAFYKWGKASKNSSKYEEAIQSFEKVIELNQSFVGAYPNRNAWSLKGDALFALNRTNGALKSYEKAIELNPNDESSWVGEGKAYRMLCMNDEAAKAYDKAIALDWWIQDNIKQIDLNKSDIDAWWRKSYAIYEMGAYERAIESFDEVNKLNPKVQWATSYKAAAYRNLAKCNKSI